VQSILSSQDKLIFLLVLTLGTLLRVAHWSPSPDGDEARYVNHAYALVDGQRPQYFDGAVAVRLPYLVFLGVWGSLFGLTTCALQSSGLLTYGIGLILLWLLANRLYGATAAHVSALLVSLLPIHIVFATHCLTDDLALCFALGAIAVWLRGFDYMETQPRTFYFLIGLSGFLGGIATGIRQPFFLLGVILPLSSLLQGHKLGRCALATVVFGMSALTYFAIEGYGFWWWLGNPLFRLSHDVLQSAESLEGVSQAMGQGSKRAALSLLQKLFYFRGYLKHYLPSGIFGIVPILVAIAAVDRWCRDKRNSAPIVIAVLVLTAYHFWGTTSLRSWSIPPVNPRYLIPPMVLGCILVGAMLASLHQSYRFPTGTVAVAGLSLLILNLWQVAYTARPNCVAEFTEHLARFPAEARSRIVVPESVKRYFLPRDYWHNIEGMPVVPDEMVARIEEMDLSNVAAVAVPNEQFYRYSHIGVVDALTRTASWWDKRTIVGEKWPRYLVLTGKPSDRVIGYVYYKVVDVPANAKQ
jgi:4-amino-4-deoxy-L-arabinose transferase-like glycosyltransferase